jgi:DNA-binding PucR family transcriptional regulator
LIHLTLSGAWGYTQTQATVIEANEHAIPLSQLEHMLISMRTYLEMNMTLEKKQRYGSININETHRDQIKTNSLVFDKVTYEITAMQEDIYASFINEYKEGYGKENFDLNDHFKRRKEATLTRIVTYWFEVSKII